MREIIPWSNVVQSDKAWSCCKSHQLRKISGPFFIRPVCCWPVDFVLDEIIVFRQLTKDEVGQIAEIMLKEVFERISMKGIQLEVTDRFKTRLIDEGYNPSYGARPLRRAVMRLLEDSLAEEVLSEKIKAGDTAVVDVGEDNKVKVLLGEKFEVLQES